MLHLIKYVVQGTETGELQLLASVTVTSPLMVAACI